MFRNWQSVQDEVLRRIRTRVWKPGDLIPNEADLAEEFGCARSTVNRALRAVAEAGLLDRKRKAGTRVAAQPVAKATLSIAVIRREVEERCRKYSYQRITRAECVPPLDVSAAMRTPAATTLLYVRALHLADDTPYALESRWINTDVVPGALQEPFQDISANEWLLQHAPYTDGEISFSAVAASTGDAQALGCAEGSALFAIDRLTWDADRSVTKVRLLFAPGHQMRTVL
ncbi:GntR family transcriptional regulator [uncultured Tateyamaria sp.]|uniref:GntR family transcriptional regulator n=1 Tax=uncultured Tateyamaria sp. TaxID=455651 RepID=UPI00261A1FAE|nr:GntR family transcriptional regulator [uncultured Tateyamaria sp.]